MKINITYHQEEVRKMRLILRFIEGLMPAVKVRFSDRHAPYYHVYLTITPPEENGNLQRKNPP
ncbi:MAG: hypothetical protein PUE91_07430 [Clostridiales bacterium]|nr:hypothetical protein [Clostridiales bacterium]